MREELARVLAYPHLVRRQALDQQVAEQVLVAYDRAVTLCPMAPKARFTCTDADDQKFIDLAAAHATQGTGTPRVPVVLLSKDKAVLRLKKRLATLGVTVLPRWLPDSAPTPTLTGTAVAAA
jgi:predicted nucleic acid-binding protein